MSVLPRCSLHPDQLARLECLRCERFACYLCARRLSAQRPDFACTRCQGLLTPLGKLLERVKQAVPFTTTILEAPRYLTRRSVLTLLGVLAIVATPLRWAATHSMFAGLTVALIVAGLEAAYFFRILETTAYGADELEMFDLGTAREEVVRHFLLMLWSALPLIVAIAWFGVEAYGSALLGLVALVDPRLLLHDSGPAALAIFGVVCWPLLLIGGALGKSVGQMYSPANWVRTLARMGKDYWLGAAAFYAVLVVQIFVVTPVAIALHATLPFVGAVMATFLGYLPMALKARVLGLACRPHM